MRKTVLVNGGQIVDGWEAEKLCDRSGQAHKSIISHNKINSDLN